ncbi:MAG: PEGA domain-containing protein [Halanaerobiaceae bacterium]
MKKFIFFVLVLTVLLSSSFAVLASEDGAVEIDSFSATISGVTLPGATVSLDGKDHIIVTSGDFEFIVKNRGMYKITISKEGYQTVIREVEVQSDELIDLGYIELTENDSANLDDSGEVVIEDDSSQSNDTMEITSPNNNQAGVSATRSSNGNVVTFGTLKVTPEFSLVDVNYSRESNNSNTDFFAEDLLLTIDIKEPVFVYDYPFYLGFQLNYISGVEGTEAVNQNNSLYGNMRSNFDYTSYHFNVGFDQELEVGKAHFFAGLAYDKIDIDNYSPNSHLNYSDQSYNGDGLVIGGGLESVLSGVELPYIGNVNWGFDFSYTSSTFDVTSNYYSNNELDGSKSIFDIWAGYRGDYSMFVGYKLLSISAREQYDLPSFNSSINGPYVKVGFSF